MGKNKKKSLANRKKSLDNFLSNKLKTQRLLTLLHQEKKDKTVELKEKLESLKLQKKESDRKLLERRQTREFELTKKENELKSKEEELKLLESELNLKYENMRRELENEMNTKEEELKLLESELKRKEVENEMKMKIKETQKPVTNNIVKSNVTSNNVSRFDIPYDKFRSLKPRLRKYKTIKMENPI